MQLFQTDEASMVNGRKHINKQTHTHTHTHTHKHTHRVLDNYADGNNKTIIGSNEKSLKKSLLVDFKTLNSLTITT